MTVFLATSLHAQQRRAAPSPARGSARATEPKEPEPTFETLLSADRYRIYGEVRSLGQLLRSGGAGEIIEPIMKLAEPPKEFKALVKFLNANADMLATSRLLFAAWPAILPE